MITDNWKTVLFFGTFAFDYSIQPFLIDTLWYIE